MSVCNWIITMLAHRTILKNWSAFGYVLAQTYSGAFLISQLPMAGVFCVTLSYNLLAV